jgi:putative hemolysin
MLRLLSGVPARTSITNDGNLETLMADGDSEEVFVPAEKQMIRGVLGLADRPVGSIMTPRPEVSWVDLDEAQEKVLATIKSSSHAHLLLSQGSIDEIIGIVRKQDLLDHCIESRALDVRAVARPPVVVYEVTSILKTLELFKQTPVHMAVVINEYGSLQGVVTQTDLLEAIAGDLPDPHGTNGPEAVPRPDGSFVLDAAISINNAKELLGLTDLSPRDYHTVAGFALSQLGRVPDPGDQFDFAGWRFEIVKMDGPRIGQLLATRTSSDPVASGAHRT